MEKCIFCIHEWKEMFLLKLCFQPFVETSLCLFGLIHLSVHWIQRQLLHSTIQGHLTTKLAEPCQWFYKFKIIEKSVQVMCCCKILPTYTSNVWFFQSPDSILCSLPVAWGWGVRGKGRAQLYVCTSFWGFGFFWGFLGPLRGKCNERRKLLLHFLHIRTLDLAAWLCGSLNPHLDPSKIRAKLLKTIYHFQVQNWGFTLCVRWTPVSLCCHTHPTRW